MSTFSFEKMSSLAIGDARKEKNVVQDEFSVLFVQRPRPPVLLSRIANNGQNTESDREEHHHGQLFDKAVAHDASILEELKQVQTKEVRERA